MKNYDWTKFTKRIAIKAPMKTIYNAWTTSQEIEKWFLSRAVFFDTNGAEISSSSQVKLGGSHEWSWYLYDIVDQAEVVEANGKDLFQFHFAGECLVTVQLTMQDEYTIVELSQENIPIDDESKRGIRLGCDSGWSFFLLNLKSFYESGVDLRNKDEKLKGMLNN